MRWLGLPILIFGTGGTSVESYQIIKRINACNPQPVYDFRGFIGPNADDINQIIVDGKQVVTCDSELFSFIKPISQIGLVIPFGFPQLKKKVHEKLINLENVVYPNIIHPQCVANLENLVIGKGNIIYQGVTITAGVELGDFNIIGPQVAIGHDSRMASYNVINPLASISGNVDIGNGCLVGTGSNILQQLKINDDSIIGAGAVVTKDVEGNSTVVGIPAKPISERVE